jgi:FAD/FMN-containing dehydrogenase/Fe-S oxidoreductase
MDQQRERIQEDLRGLVSGEVRCDDLTLAAYASDASIYEIMPLGVVCPRSLAEVVATVRYAAENKLPLHARGAGSSLSGGSIGPGLVLDFSRHMRRIVATDDEGAVRVQPGVVLASLNAELARSGRQFGPDPANAAVTTVGGVISIDASGSHYLRYGSTRACVRKLQLVLADGEVVEVGREPLARADAESTSPRRQQLVTAVTEVLLRNHSAIAAHQPPWPVGRGGYQLNDVLDDGHLDLARLVCGSEGTLALITEATLETTVLPVHVGMALLLFDRLEDAARAVELILPLGIAACDLLDRRHLGLARESDVRFDLLVPATVEAALVVEVQCESQAEVRERLTAITVKTRHDARLAIDARQTVDAHEIELYWQLATRVVPRLHRLRGSTRPIPFVEDVYVPPLAFADFLVALQNILKVHQITASLYGHVGHGRLHIRPFMNLADPDDIGRMRVLADEVYRAVLAAGGSIGGELGDGLSRTSFLRQQYGPLCDVFAEVKRAFDPAALFNPGKIVGDDPAQLTSNLRAVRATVATRNRDLGESPADAAAVRAAAPSDDAAAAAGGLDSAAATAVMVEPVAIASANVVSLELNWSGESILDAARQCNGCGACRTQSLTERMCPIFRALPREEASPRAKANLMRSIFAGRLDPELLPSDQFKEIAGLCVHCHQCRLDCPAGVDVCKLMAEARAAHVAHSGLRPSEWLLTRLDLVGAFAGLVSPLANWAIGNRFMRWLLERLFGLAHGRKLPRLAQRNFARRAARMKLSRTDRETPHRVLYFADVYANYFDAQLGEATVAVLRHNGVSVYVPEETMQSGMAMVAQGAVERAKLLAERNVAILADAVRQGYHIVASEPAAALCLMHEYPNLLDDEEARLVAANTSDVCTYLWRLHLEKELRLDFNRIDASVAYHQPCMIRAMQVATPSVHLMNLIPGLTVAAEEHGCSGMAGTFGLQRVNYRTSLRAGWDLISWLRKTSADYGATECSSCKLQMEQGTTKPTIHPVKLLAISYGLMPELKKLLTAKSGELVTT